MPAQAFKTYAGHPPECQRCFEERVTCSSVASRQSLPAEVFHRQYSNLTEGISMWDFYPPDYNCPLLKEHVGQ